MYRYKISYVLEVLSGSSFMAILDLGMGIYLKKHIIMTGIFSPRMNNEKERPYALRSIEKLKDFLSGPNLSIELEDYHDDKIFGKIYTDQFDDSINWIMYLKGYVWEKENENNNTITLNSLI
jgi:hypothetical protein